MLRSFRTRLLLAFMTIVALAVGTVVGVTVYTSSQFHSFVEEGQSARHVRILTSLAGYYERNRTWSGVEAWLEQMEQLFGERLALADGGGALVAHSGGGPGGRPWAWREVAGRPIVVEDQKVGTLYLPPSPRSLPLEEAFLAGVSRSVWWAAVVATGGGGLLALWLTRRTVRPIRELTVAARSVQQGNLDQEVSVVSGDEIGELASAFNSMAAELKQQEELRRHMVSDVAHELRTPLANIRGYLEGLRDALVQPTPSTFDSLHEEALLLTRLVDDLQDLALAEAGALRLETQPVDVGDTVDRALAGLAAVAQRSDIELDKELAGELPLVSADPDRVLQVLSNLLNNALRHTPSGGSIFVSAATRGRWVEFQVRDSGPGIPEDQLNYIFERFYRADPSRSRATGGAGLGLTVAKKLVEAHGGTIWAENAKGGGAVLFFTLPATS